jgi:hypothetical protein
VRPKRYTQSSLLFTVDCVIGVNVLGIGAGAGTELGTTGGTELKLGITGGTELKDGGGSVPVGPGVPLIVVGPPTDPEQTTPSGQHPMFPLSAS